MAYIYKYKNYPDCPKATKLSRFFCNQNAAGAAAALFGIILMGVGILIYNASGHASGVIDTLLLVLGFVFFLGGSFLVPALFKALKISDRVYEKMTGRKVSEVQGISELVGQPWNPFKKETERGLDQLEEFDQKEKTERSIERVPEKEKEENIVMALNTLDLVAEAFDRHSIKYRTVEVANISFIEAGYNISGGPSVRVAFFKPGKEGNDIQLRINGLLYGVPKDKRNAILDACNRVNSEMRFLKFYLDKDNDLVGEADLPTSTSDDCVGENCFELFLRTMQILDRCYHYFPEAIYCGTPEDKGDTLMNALSALKDLRDHPITIPQDQEKAD